MYVQCFSSLNIYTEHILLTYVYKEFRLRLWTWYYWIQIFQIIYYYEKKNNYIKMRIFGERVQHASLISIARTMRQIYVFFIGIERHYYQSHRGEEWRENKASNSSVSYLLGFTDRSCTWLSGKKCSDNLEIEWRNVSTFYSDICSLCL